MQLRQQGVRGRAPVAFVFALHTNRLAAGDASAQRSQYTHVGRGGYTAIRVAAACLQILFCCGHSVKQDRVSLTSQETTERQAGALCGRVDESKAAPFPLLQSKLFQ